jgi:hypothetical protein
MNVLLLRDELIASDRNPKGAGRRGQDFISYLKAFVFPDERAFQDAACLQTWSLSIPGGVF